MELSDLLKKDNIVKGIAVGLVLVFVLSSFTAGILNNGTNGNANDNKTIPGSAAGDVVVNATVASYQPYIITDLHNSTIADSIRALSDVEDVMSTSQGYVVSLRSTSNITGVYSYLQSLNISGRANAVLTLPALVSIPSGNGTQEVAGGQITAKLEPIFAEGENISIKVYLKAVNLQLAEYGAPTVLPWLQEFARNATVVAMAGNTTTIIVPWENRTDAAISAAVANLTARYGAGNVSYVKKDFIVGNMAGAKPAYVAFLAGDTAYVGNFTDAAQIGKDFQNVSYPDSLLVVEASGFDANASGLGNFTQGHSYSYNIRIDDLGGPFFAPLESSRAYAQNDTVSVNVTAYAIKNVISSIVGAQEAA